MSATSTSASPSPMSVTFTSASSSVTSSVTASVLSESPQSFRKQGGTVKRNIQGKNEVWEFFQIYNEKKFKSHAFCILCKSDVNYGKTHSTSNLEKHIQRHHKKEYENIMCERANKRFKCREAENISTGIQQKLTPFMDSVGVYEECLLDWMIDSYQPLSAVQKDSFRKLTHFLYRKAPIIGEDRIRNLLSMKFFETQQNIIKILKGKNVALTTDAWTSIAKEGYVTCTLHFIEPLTWTLHYFSLGILKKDGTLRANDVVRYTEEHMKKSNLSYPQLTCIVTDTEAKLIAAGRLFKENSIEGGGRTSWHGCIDHKLQLVTKLAFKDTPESIGTMAACRAIVTFLTLHRRPQKSYRRRPRQC